MISKFLFEKRTHTVNNYSPGVSWTNQITFTQEQLDTLLAEEGWVVGDFLTLSKTPITELRQVNVIIDITDDVKKIIYGQMRRPNPYRLLQLYEENSPMERYAWVRWDDLQGYRRLTNEEFNKLITPNHDFLSRCIESHKQTHKAY